MLYSCQNIYESSIYSKNTLHSAEKYQTKGELLTIQCQEVHIIWANHTDERVPDQ